MSSFTANSEFLQEAQDSQPAAVRRYGPRINGQFIIVSVATVLALVTASECRSITHLPSLLYGAVLWGWWGLIASIGWKLAARLPPLSNLSPLAISIHLLLASALGFVHLVLLWSLGFTSAGWSPGQTSQTMWAIFLSWNRFGIELLLYGFVFGMIGIVQFRIRTQRETLKAAELEKQLSAAHLRALQMQLEPHFLFNTLNAITTLVELGRQQQATEMLRHLNAILKSTLQRSAPEKVPLSEELEIVENYLAIEQVRFADRLRLEIQIAPDALDGLVPCFLLQPIVENAIRHGIAFCEEESLVQASATREGGLLHLRVRDSGSRTKHTHPNGHGIGLKNTRERLMHFYRDQFLMNAQPLTSGGFEVAITIPFERNQR